MAVTLTLTRVNGVVVAYLPKDATVEQWRAAGNLGLALARAAEVLGV